MPLLLLSDFNLTFGRSPWFFVILAIVAFIFAVAVYRYTLPPIDRLRRALLWTLRGLALVLILLMIFEPVMNFIQSKTEKPTVAILVDQSASVGPAVENGARTSAIKTALSSSLLTDLQARANVRTFSFSDSLVEMSRDSLLAQDASGVGTDMVAAWERATRLTATEHLAAMVVISDGANNSGPNPDRAASDVRTPIYTLGVGDTTERPDAAAVELLTNEVTYVGAKVPVDIRVRGYGLKSATTQVRLIGPQGKVLHDESVRFADDVAESIIHATFQADQAGDVRLTAIIDSVAGESLLENNRRSVIVTVLENRAKVVLISGPPTADLSALRQVLESDSTLEVALSVELAQGKKMRGGADVIAALFDKAKLVVLVNYPSELTSSAEAGLVAKGIENQNVPVMFFAGPQISASLLNGFSVVLPVRAAKQIPGAERVILREISTHPAITGSSPLSAEWGTLPPVTGSVGNFTLESGAQIVAKLSREIVGVQENEPAVALWELKQRRGAAFLVWDCSQWKLQLAANPVSGKFYDELMGRIVRWLVAPADEKRFVIKTEKKLYSGGEKVRFTAQVYGADLSPRDDAVIDLKVSSAGRTELVPMRNRGNGRFDGELMPWGEGEYAFTAAATTALDTLGKDRGLFAVEAFNIELLNTRARFDILRSIAERSGGQFAPISQADNVLRNLKLEPREVQRKREIPLWNQSLLLWIIIGLLSLEWMLRKRSGML